MRSVNQILVNILETLNKSKVLTTNLYNKHDPFLKIDAHKNHFDRKKRLNQLLQTIRLSI